MEHTAPPRKRKRRSNRDARSGRQPGEYPKTPAPGYEGGRYRPLSDSEISRIHGTSLDVLERIGMADPTDSIRDMVLEAGGATNASGRLCFPRGLVEDTIASAARDIVLPGREPEHDLELSSNRVYFGTGGAAPIFMDLETGKFRNSTLSDIYDIGRIVDALPNIHYYQLPVVATDVEDTESLDINSAYAVMSSTTKHTGSGFFSPAGVRKSVAMFDLILGGEGNFRRRPICHLLSCFVVSPLRFAAESCDATEAAIRLGMPIRLISAGQTGATSPVTLAGSLVQALAESLAGLVFVNLVAPGHPAIMGLLPFVSDLRTGSFSGGGGEEAVMMAACAQITSFYGIPGCVSAGLTDSKIPDAQSGYEKGHSVALAAQAGANMIAHSCGMQGSLMAASLEGYVIDNDMLGAIQQAVRGVEVTDETLAFDMIEEVTDGPGHYLGHPQTLERMKRDFVYPIVADRQSYDQWWETGSRDVRQRARDYCMEILKSTGSSCIPTAIDERIRHQLDIRLSRQYMRFGANL